MHRRQGPLTVERINRLIVKLHRSQNGGDMTYVMADAIKVLYELLECRRREGEMLQAEKIIPDSIDTISRLISNKINVYCYF